MVTILPSRSNSLFSGSVKSTSKKARIHFNLECRHYKLHIPRIKIHQSKYQGDHGDVCN